MAGEGNDADAVSVTIRLTEAGCSFEHTAQVHPETPFAEFKRAVERMFDQRLQLSFRHRGPLPRMATPLPTGGASRSYLRTTSDSASPSPSAQLPSLPSTAPAKGAGRSAGVSRIAELAANPPNAAVHVALDETTWPIFLSRPVATCRAWSVFPGLSLSCTSSVGTCKKWERIEKFTEGTRDPDMPHDKRMTVLYKRLYQMATPPPPRGARAPKGPRQLDPARTLTPEQQDAAVSRLWADVEKRQDQQRADQQEEEARVLTRMRFRVRKGRPEERSGAEEDFCASVDAKAEAQKEKRAELEAKYEDKVPKISDKCGANSISPDDIDAAVGRLFPWMKSEGGSSAAEQRAVMAERLRRQEEKHFGKHKPQKKLTAEELEARIQSLYHDALSKKDAKHKALEEQYAAPSPPRCVMSQKALDDLVPRLAAGEKRQ